MKQIISSVNVSELDILNSNGAYGFRMMPENSQIVGAAIVLDNNKRVATLFTDSGVYSGISQNIADSVEMLIDLIKTEPEKKYAATVQGGERDFLRVVFKEANG